MTIYALRIMCSQPLSSASQCSDPFIAPVSVPDASAAPSVLAAAPAVLRKASYCATGLPLYSVLPTPLESELAALFGRLSRVRRLLTPQCPHDVFITWV